ncbi:MAG TPA: histidine kinase dimerization/phospho-acceptor domain-containing protein, partial [Thioalkalivibrio sp.]|nr:histidine kinase dimerization/phospho-acceptor domain-containing protein [Thioalkalivibrio sp.]
MKLSVFIVERMEQILAHWDEYARKVAPESEDMSHQELRDHAEEMLRTVALDIESPQSARQQARKSEGGDDDKGASSAASKHGRLRQQSNFTLLQMSSEFRALRATVLRLWLQQLDALSPEVLEDVIRFNESIDQALAESIVTFSERADQSRDLFGAILGHDLRGPLSSISLAGDILEGQLLSAGKVVELGANIKRSARFMTSMVDDMLGFARTRMGEDGIPVEPAP